MKTKKILFSLLFLSIFSSLCFGMHGKAESFIEAVKNNDTKKVRDLLTQGINIDSTDKDGTTALQWAVFFLHQELIVLFLAKGANAKIVNFCGQNLIHLVVTNFPRCFVELLGTDLSNAVEKGVKIINLLFEHGVKINERSKILGETPLDQAKRTECNQKIIDFLKLLEKQQEDEEIFDYCSLCFKNKTKDLCMLPSCGHTFHKACIGKWLAKNPTCPYCSRPTALEELR